MESAVGAAAIKKDKQDKGNTKKLYDQAASPAEKNADRMYLQEYNSPARGTGLLAKNALLETHIVNFLKKHVQAAKSEWRDRESRLGKKKT